MNARPFDEVIPSALTIEEQALETGWKYAELVCSEHGDREYIGFLLADPGSEIVNGILLAPGQVCASALVELSAESVLQSGREARNLGKRIIGWTHSHGRMMQAFHSGTDDATHANLVRDIAPSRTTYARVDTEVQIEPAEDGLLIREGNRPVGLLHSGAQSDDAARTVVLSRIVPVATAYSLVVNANRHSHCEIAIQQWCPACGHTKVTSRRIALDVIPSDRKVKLDVAAMRREVRKKVTPYRYQPQHHAYGHWQEGSPSQCSHCPSAHCDKGQQHAVHHVGAYWRPKREGD